jgi:hypothetical protein
VLRDNALADDLLTAEIPANEDPTVCDHNAFFAAVRSRHPWRENTFGGPRWLN